MYGNTIIRVYSYKWCNSTMTRDGKRLGEIIAEVQQAADVSATELLLFHSVLDPVEPHVNRLGHFRRDCAIGNANRTLIVAKNCRRRLGMTHVDEDGSFVGGDAGSGEEAGIFGFESRRANNRDAGGVGGDGMVKEDGLGVVTVIAAEEVMAARDAAGFRARQVRCVRHDPKDHVGGTVNLVPIGMGGDETEQTLNAKHRTLGRVGLLGGKRASGREDARVD